MDPVIEQFISVDPQIHHGTPCFRGSRIPVYVVLELLEGGLNAQTIVSDEYYPQLTLDHVRAALHWAAQYAKNQEFLSFEQPG